MIHYTEQQLQVIRHPQGHAKVIACPGSGKTQTLIGRLQFLSDAGVNPRQQLILMFNRSAQQDFEARMHQSLARSFQPEVRTFHSFAKILCEHLVRLGFLPFADLLANDNQIKRYLKHHLIEAGKDAGAPSHVLFGADGLDAFVRFVEGCKAELTDPRQTFHDMEIGPEFSFFPDAYDRYEAFRAERCFRTFSDWLSDPALLLQRNPAARAAISDRKSHIVVDEAQDMAQVQLVLLDAVAGTRASVMAVGDIDQTLYSWRSARPELLLSEFDKVFPSPTQYQLSQSFRFGHRIALAASQVIAHNQQRTDLLCVSAPGTPDTRIQRLSSPGRLSTLIPTLLSQGYSVKDIVVLPRTYAAAPVEIDLLEHGIQTRILGGSSAFDSPVLKSIVAWCHVALDGLSGGSRPVRRTLLQAILTTPHSGLSTDTIERTVNKLASTPSLFPDVLRQLADRSTPKTATTCRSLALLWSRTAGKLPQSQPAATFIDKLLIELGAHTSFQKSMNASTASDKSFLSTYFSQYARERHLSIRDFVYTVARLSDSREEDPPSAILIQSIHRAKGCQWKVVIVPGLEEGQFPLITPGRKRPDSGQLEEERRLFYVAITRAQELCVLMHPADAHLDCAMASGDNVAPPDAKASRFLYESAPDLTNTIIDAAFSGGSTALEARRTPILNRYLKHIASPLRITHKSSKRSTPTHVQQAPTAYTANGKTFSIDQSVTHPAFGSGRIVDFVRDGQIVVVGFGPTFTNEKWLDLHVASKKCLSPVQLGP